MAERAEPEKRLFEVDPRGSPSPSTRGSLYRTHETGPLFSHRHLSSLLIPLSPSSCEISPPRRQMYARGTRVCLPLPPFQSRGSRVSLRSKRTVLQLDEVLTSLSRAHLSFVRPVDWERKPGSYFPDASQRLPIFPPPPPPRLRDFAREAGHVFTWCPRFCIVNRNDRKLMSGEFRNSILFHINSVCWRTFIII